MHSLEKSVEKAIKEPGQILFKDNYWYADNDHKFKTFEEMLEYKDKQRKEEIKKMSPEKRKALQEKDKKERAKIKADQKKLEEKWKDQRYKRGFADVDVWSIDHWFLTIMPLMLKELVKNKHGYQPKLGYKIENKKLVKTNKEITEKDEKAVFLYLADKMVELKDLCSFEDMPNNPTKAYYKEHDKKVKSIKKEVFSLFSDVFFDLWD